MQKRPPGASQSWPGIEGIEMIRIYTRGNYDRRSRLGFFYFFTFSDTTRIRYKESGNFECRNVFQAECKGIFRALGWWAARREIREDIEVPCSPVVSMYLNSLTSKYFKPRPKDDMSAVGRILQVIAFTGLKVVYTPRGAGDEPCFDVENHKLEAGVCH